MSKATGSPFGRPQRDFDPQAFLNEGVSGLRNPAPVEPVEPAPPSTPPPPAPSIADATVVPSAMPVLAISKPDTVAAVSSRTSSAKQRPQHKQTAQDRRNTASYKHKEANHEKLRQLAHRLDRPMGEMLDEALERMFPEWVGQLPPEPRF